MDYQIHIISCIDKSEFLFELSEFDKFAENPFINFSLLKQLLYQHMFQVSYKWNQIVGRSCKTMLLSVRSVTIVTTLDSSVA